MRLKQRLTILTVGVLSLVAVAAIFASTAHVFAVTSTTSHSTSLSTTAAPACTDNVQQDGNYSGEFGCQAGPDSSTSAGDGPALEP